MERITQESPQERRGCPLHHHFPPPQPCPERGRATGGAQPPSRAQGSQPEAGERGEDARGESHLPGWRGEAGGGRSKEDAHPTPSKHGEGGKQGRSQGGAKAESAAETIFSVAWGSHWAFH